MMIAVETSLPSTLRVHRRTVPADTETPISVFSSCDEGSAPREHDCGLLDALRLRCQSNILYWSLVNGGWMPGVFL